MPQMIAKKLLANYKYICYLMITGLLCKAFIGFRTFTVKKKVSDVIALLLQTLDKY